MVYPDIDSLRCFVAAARQLNFRAAARAVALTPAALGQRIRQLEDQLGARLFHRTTRSIVLTEAGLALIPVAQDCIDRAGDCVRAARGEIGPTPMDITMGTRHELGLSWVVPQLDAIQRSHPTLTIHLYFGSGADLLLRVRTLEVDCAIPSSRLTDPKLDSTRLHPETYVLVGSRALLRKTPLDKPAQAKDHTLLDVSADLPLFRYWRDAPGGGDRLRFSRLNRVGTIAAMRELVLAGKGIAVLPEYLVKPDLKAKKMQIVFPEVEPLSDWFRLIYRTDDPRRSLYESLAATMLKTPLR